MTSIWGEICHEIFQKVKPFLYLLFVVWAYFFVTGIYNGVELLESGYLSLFLIKEYLWKVPSFFANITLSEWILLLLLWKVWGISLSKQQTGAESWIKK